MNMNQLYNKTILIKPRNVENENIFDILYYTYNGKLTAVAEKFNKITVDEAVKIVNNSNDDVPIYLAAYLGFSNLFLYYLTFKGNPYERNDSGQSCFHAIFYRGELKILNLVLNYERMSLKLTSLENIENIKKSYGFSKLDIVKGKLSRAVSKTETNLKKFNSFQRKLKEEAENFIKNMIKKLQEGLATRDKEGRNPLHYGAMSKFPLSYLLINTILDFELFALNGWNEFLAIFQETQDLEVKAERWFDPRRCQRLDRELMNLLGDHIIAECAKTFKVLKNELMRLIINSQDNMGDTVLHVAAFHGDFRIVKKLLNYGADKFIKNNDGKMPVDMAKDNHVRNVLTNLNKAAKNADEKNMVELVNFGHDINSKISIFSEGPIHKIIESNKEDKHDVLKKMLDMGADPNLKDSNGWSSLHYACQLGDFESVVILLEHKADIDSYSNNHRTPLHLASSQNHPKIVHHLLENRADPNFKDNYECTPLHLAAKEGNIECMSLLLVYGSNLYEKDFRGWNILHYAAFQGHKRAVRFIVKYDADFDVLQNQRNTQNKLAIEIVRDPTVKPFFISLWHTAKDGDLDTTRMLLNEGEKIDEQTTFWGNTPLHLAVLNNHYLLVRLLLEKKANKTITNKDGITAVEYAEIINNAIVKFCEKNFDRDTLVDLKIFVRNVINKNEKILNSTICKSNHSVKIWKILDFSQKICKILIN